MPFLQCGSVRYLTFELLAEAGAPHAVFTRRGGGSPAPWSGLNLGGAVGDDQERVARNRKLALEAAGRPPDSVYEVWQVHGSAVGRADAPQANAYPQVDAVLTDRPGVTLLMRFADCVPILLYDPVRKAAGLVHAGWQGTVKRTAAAAVHGLRAEYGSRPADLLAAIGPSIGAHHYPVGPAVAARVREAFGMDASALLSEGGAAGENGPVHFDLWAANQLILEQAGVRSIENSGLCTACHLEDWYSHRAEKGKTGRFGVCMWVKD
jgi:YfiH family protein